MLINRIFRRRIRQDGFGHIALVLVLVVVIVAGLVGWRVYSARKEKLAGSSSQSATKSGEEVKFSVDIFDPSDIAWIGPLGELNGGYEESQTIAGVLVNIKPEAVAGGKEITVKAPAKMTLERYAYFRDPMDGGTGWTLFFKLSENVTMRLDHIARASDKIIQATSSQPKDNSADEPPKSKVSFEPGEVIAYTSGTKQAHNWNIYVYDKTHVNMFINQRRYESDEVGRRFINAVCPFDYYPADKKDIFIALMGQGKAGEAKDCGDVSRDKDGTISGMWHLPSASGTAMGRKGIYTSPMSVYLNSGGTVIIYQVNDKRLDVDKNNPTFKDPKEITSQHCYEPADAYGNKSGYIFLRMESTAKLNVAYGASGKCPKSFPQSQYTTYTR